MPDRPLPVVRRVDSRWSTRDRLGRLLCRLSNRFRMRYRVDPGLYALGEPDAGSPVLVTANYKLSFDLLRRGAGGMATWILVLDTRGINVWCAAGKGTFGTDELVRTINATGLAEVVDHRRLVLPQLGAPGVQANRVLQETGFRAAFGPVRAADVSEYLRAGGRATPAMRTVRFPMTDRLALTPMELIPALRYYPVYLAMLAAALGVSSRWIAWSRLLDPGLPYAAMGLAALLAGTVLGPLLLPWIPFRSFALKGWLLGLAVTVPLVWLDLQRWSQDPILTAFALLLFPAASSALLLGFTGSTPFTGLSGVKKELRFALPAYLSAAGVSIILLVCYTITNWRSS